MGATANSLPLPADNSAAVFMAWGLERSDVKAQLEKARNGVHQSVFRSSALRAGDCQPDSTAVDKLHVNQYPGTTFRSQIVESDRPLRRLGAFNGDQIESSCMKAVTFAANALISMSSINSGVGKKFDMFSQVMCPKPESTIKPVRAEKRKLKLVS